jgi:hypothetical protein
MVSVGSLNLTGAGGGGVGGGSSAALHKRQKTLIFWDYESIHPTTANITAPHLYRKTKDHLKEKGVATGVLHCTAFALPTASNKAALDQLDDLQITVVRGTATLHQLQQEMKQSLSDVGTNHQPSEIAAIVVMSHEKCFVRDIKALADLGFEVCVVHNVAQGSPEADILETYASRSFVISDIVGLSAATSPTAPGVPNGLVVVADSQTTTTTAAAAAAAPAPAGGIVGKLQHVQGLTVLVEGRRVSLDELEKNDAVHNAIRHPTPAGLRWCQLHPVQHDIQRCPYAHYVATAVAAASGSVIPTAAGASAPPTYIQAVEQIGKSPMMGPSSGSVVGAPPLPAGTSPIMAFHPSGSHHHHVAGGGQSPYLQHHHHPQHLSLGQHVLGHHRGGVHHVITPGAHFPAHHHSHQQLPQHFLSAAGPPLLPPPSIPVLQRGSHVHAHSASNSAASTAAGTALPPPPPPPAAGSLWGDVTAATAAPPSAPQIDDDTSSSHVAQMEALLSSLTHAAPVTPTRSDMLPQHFQAPIGSPAPHHSQQPQLDFFSLLGPPTTGHKSGQAQSRLKFGSGLLADSDDDDDERMPVSPTDRVVVVAAVSSSSTSVAAVAVKKPPVIVSTQSTNKAQANPAPQPPAPVSAAAPSQDTPSRKSVADTSISTTPAAVASAWGSRQASQTLDTDDREDLPTLESLAGPASSTTTGGGKSTVRKAGGGSAAAGAAASAKQSGGKLTFASIVGAAKSPGNAPPPPPAALAASAKKSSAAAATAAQRPRVFLLDGVPVAADLIVRNKFVEMCHREGTNVGRYCTDHRAHSMMDCLNAHKDKYALLQGGEVDGSVLLTNKALENLRANTTYKGNFCTSPKPHDPLKCTYLHRKSGY